MSLTDVLTALAFLALCVVTYHVAAAVERYFVDVRLEELEKMRLEMLPPEALPRPPAGWGAWAGRGDRYLTGDLHGPCTVALYVNPDHTATVISGKPGLHTVFTLPINEAVEEVKLMFRVMERGNEAAREVLKGLGASLS